VARSRISGKDDLLSGLDALLYVFKGNQVHRGGGEVALSILLVALLLYLLTLCFKVTTALSFFPVEPTMVRDETKPSSI